MPYYQLIDAEGKILKVREMEHETAMLLNNDLDDGTIWKRGLAQKSGRQPIGTLDKLLYNLDLEGFNDESVNIIRRWSRRSVKERHERQEEFKELEVEFSKAARELPPETRRILGRFIGLQCQEAFRAGLSVGFATVGTINYFDLPDPDSLTD